MKNLEIQNPKVISMTISLIGIEFITLLLGKVNPGINAIIWELILFFAVIGSLSLLLASLEKIELTKNKRILLWELLVICLCMVAFFAFHYYFLQSFNNKSFVGLQNNIIDYLYNSTLIFFFNPTVEPKNWVAESLILIQMFTSFIFGVFILQNINDWKRKDRL